jgi:hypothetical protein
MTHTSCDDMMTAVDGDGTLVPADGSTIAFAA